MPAASHRSAHRSSPVARRGLRGARLLAVAVAVTGLTVTAGVLVGDVEAGHGPDLALDELTGGPDPADTAYRSMPPARVDHGDGLVDRVTTHLGNRGGRYRALTTVKLQTRSTRRAEAVARRERIAALPPYKVLVRTRPIARIPPPPPKPVPITFQIGTLNILGSQHARNGTGRAAELAGAIIGRGVDVVGMQEVQRDQLGVLQSQLGGYGIWPGTALGNQGIRLQIAYRSDLFEQVDQGSIIAPFDHQQVPIPYVLLRDRATKGEFWVIDIHNAPRDQQRDRDIDKGIEINLVHQLQATGKPVILVGDSNEHTEFACPVMSATGMVSSGGGYGGGGCYGGVGPFKIDWILASGEVSFSGHYVDYDPPIRSATDHSFVHATITVTPPAATD